MYNNNNNYTKTIFFLIVMNSSSAFTLISKNYIVNYRWIHWDLIKELEI